MIAVVTGSSGFIGSHLVDALLERGATVRALLRPESSGPHDPRVASFRADLLDDRSVRESPIWDDVTHVFHVGGVTKRRTLEQFRQGNVIPTANLLSAILARGVPLRRFVLVSTQAAAGPADEPGRPVREMDAPTPIESYGRSKLAAELVCRRYSGEVPISIVRPGAVYGPRDVDFLNVFREVTHPVAFHAAPRDQALSIVYVSDLVDGVLRAAESEASLNRVYFVAGDSPVTWRDIYDGAARVAGTEPRQLQLPAAALWLAGQAGNLLSLLTGKHFLMNSNKVTLSRPRWWLCDSSRAHQELGWTATTSLDDGLRQTYQWYLNAGWLRAPSSAPAGSVPQETHP
jgi:nucleoside-diphosphate-sugar epimerase